MSIIERYEDTPAGELISAPLGEFDMSDDWRQRFAIIRGDNKKIHLLVAGASFGSAQMLEVKRRAAELRQEIVVTKTTADIIQLLYQKYDTRNTASGSVAQHTDIEKLANDIITLAAQMGASDIHIESRVSHADVRVRVNGILHNLSDITHDSALSLGFVLYGVHADAASKETSWDPSSVMDASIEWQVGSKAYQLRFSSSPIYPSGGFQIVMRMLSMEASGMDLDSLGYSPAQKAMLDVITSGASGMLILCGPTNSGKSTTLQAMMSRIHAKRGDAIKMISVEDPVEYIMPHVCQINIARKRKTHLDSNTGSAFTTFLRGTLRQDPDVVMVGEIRDHESASVVKDLVLAGRKLLATLHTYSALWAYIRLREIGVPWEILTMPGFIAGIVYQRLVPVLCPSCSIRYDQGGADRIPADVRHRVLRVADMSSDDIRVKGDGCEHCKHTGIFGRTVCAEFVLPDRMLLKHLVDGNFLEAEQYWRTAGVGAEGGGVTALSQGIWKMKRGLISPLDVEEQIGILTSDMVMEDGKISASELSSLTGGSEKF